MWLVFNGHSAGEESIYYGKIENMFTATDMTIGTPWKQIVLFAVPMLVGNIAQQMYNTVDSIVVGRYVGDNALAAVGSASPIVNLMLVLFIGISAGAGIMVSQYFGAKAREDFIKDNRKLHYSFSDSGNYYDDYRPYGNTAAFISFKYAGIYF